MKECAKRGSGEGWIIHSHLSFISPEKSFHLLCRIAFGYFIEQKTWERVKGEVKTVTAVFR